jgi:hypothetical protein
MPIKMTEEELDKTVKFFMRQHQGRENAVERWSLVVKVFGVGSDIPRTDDNPSDRLIREAVSRLRTHGVMICDMGDGRGRFVATTEDEWRAFRSSYLKPLVSRASVIRAMDKHAVKVWPNLLQPALFEIDDLMMEAR